MKIVFFCFALFCFLSVSAAGVLCEVVCCGLAYGEKSLAINSP
jgi:hypothetical protein